MTSTDDAQRDGVPESVRRFLQTPVVLDRAEQIAERDGDLAAKHFLDSWLRGSGQLPRRVLYLSLAADLGRAGWPTASGLLTRIARIDMTAAIEQDRWDRRYAARSPVLREADAVDLLTSGRAELDPDGPYRGIDGAEYAPGFLDDDAENAVLVITNRGMREAITGWDSHAQMREWLASRGTTGSADLSWSAPASRSRTALEEMVLARLIACPQDIPRLGDRIVPGAFTADMRYETYLALLAGAAEPQAYMPPVVEDRLVQRVAYLPDRARELYGGDDARLGRQYVRRLSASYVSEEQAQEAAAVIGAEDRALNIGDRRTPGVRADTSLAQQHIPERRGAATGLETGISRSVPALLPPEQRPGGSMDPSRTPRVSR